jgi:hypothetical protein
LRSIPVQSANVIKACTSIRVLTSTLLYLIASESSCDTLLIACEVVHFNLNCTLIIEPPLWSSDQGSWLQIQRSGFDSRSYQILCEVVGLQRGLLSLFNTIEKLLERINSDSELEIRYYGSRGSLR